VRCLSQSADLIKIKKEDFLRLQTQGATWNQILKAVAEKARKIHISLVLSRASLFKIQSKLNQDIQELQDKQSSLKKKKKTDFLNSTLDSIDSLGLKPFHKPTQSLDLRKNHA